MRPATALGRRFCRPRFNRHRVGTTSAPFHQHISRAAGASPPENRHVRAGGRRRRRRGDALRGRRELRVAGGNDARRGGQRRRLRRGERSELRDGAAMSRQL